jgi:hypothetical protein
MGARERFGWLVLMTMGLGSGASAASGGAPAPKDADVTLVGRFVEGDQEILAFKPGATPVLILPGSPIAIEQPAGRPTPWSAVAADPGGDPVFIVRRQIPPAGDKQVVIVHAPIGDGPGASPAVRFTIGDVSQAPLRPALEAHWLLSLRDHLAQVPDRFADFARQRVEAMEQARRAKEPRPALAKDKRAARVAEPIRRPDPSSLANLMDTTTGLTSMREALQTDRPLRTRLAAESASVPLAQLAAPKVARHPWPEMLAALGRTPPDEPLAHAAPANFYYLRFGSLAHLFRVLDEADAWITPAATLGTGFAQNQDLGKRYEAQLGLQRSLTSRLLGPQVVTDLAVVGSDPYLREGSDLTFIFRVKSPTAFAAGLVSALAGHLGEHGAQRVETEVHAGESITITRSADGVVRQHRAQAGEFTVVSNSLGAMRAVLDTIKHKRAALADAPDFRYLMARDGAVPADVLGFLSDAFVAEVIGPRQKILESRRLLALSDLLAPGYAALLYGWLYGRPPRSLEEIVSAGILGRDELRHVSGETIAFAPGEAARSPWGTVAALTPLVDLPAPDKVSGTERDAYRMFADSYQRAWSQYMDPVALRLRLDAAGKGPLRADLRVLPILEGSEYREMQRTVGDARIDVAALGSGAELALGVGAQATVRRLVGEMASTLPLGLRAQLDWLGDAAFIGVDDRFDVKAVFDAFNGEDRLREKELAKLFVEAPLHAGLAVRNLLTAGLTLSALRKLAADAAPGAIAWGERGKERGVAYVGISAARGGQARELAGDLSLYYAFCKDYLLLSLSQTTLKARIDDCLDGRLPRTAPAGKAAAAQPPQLVFGLAMKKGGPLWQVLGASLQASLEEAHEVARHRGEILRRGSPGLDKSAQRRLAVAYLGGAPVDAAGGELLGTASSAPRFGRHRQAHLAPAPDGSPAGRFVGALARARSEIAFDREVTVAGAKEPMQSLHVVLTVGGKK